MPSANDLNIYDDVEETACDRAYLRANLLQIGVKMIFFSSFENEAFCGYYTFRLQSLYFYFFYVLSITHIHFLQ